MLPVVAIVGRPNVGKSSLLNALLGRRYAIVDDMPGVTRDRVSAQTEIAPGRWVELVDTGGIGIVDKQQLEEHVEAQIEQALAICDAIVFVTDAHEGCTPIDRDIARALRTREVPIVLAVNKTESKKATAALPEFAELGFEAFAVSALEGTGIEDLRAWIATSLPAEEGGPGGPPPEPVLKVAIVGRVNVGKSTFLNALAGEERAIVSELPGTTRDTVDLRIEKDGRTILVMDTAGLKRERSVQGSVDFYAQRRAEHAIERSEVCLLLLDCTDEISRGDRQIARFIEDAVKPVVIVANKWDLAKGKMEMEAYADYLSKKLTGLHYAPVAFVSAKEGKNVFGALETAESLAKQGRERVGTPQINKAIERAMTESRPPTRMTKEPKIYYGTQTGRSPPTIMLFVNDPRLFGQAFRRFLENRFREVLPFTEIPLRIVYKRRKSIFSKREART
jgi:GTP-binding protein